MRSLISGLWGALSRSPGLEYSPTQGMTEQVLVVDDSLIHQKPWSGMLHLPEDHS